MPPPSDTPERVYEVEAYRAELGARVVAASENRVRLDRTIFFPGGGGQPADRGTLADPAGARWSVVSLEKTDAGIEHKLDRSPLPPSGTELALELDWPLRYLHMRYHTAVHLLSGAAFRRFGSAITGSQLGAEGARVDLAIPEARANTAEELVAQANRQVDAALPVEVRWVEAAELVRNPSLVRVRPDLLPSDGRLRLIDIVGFDVQADGGTHVRSSAEVGRIRLERFENKGARNKRLYVTLEPRPAPALPRAPGPFPL
jgi:misacylated tRNA(Ala) deacylase